MAAHDVQFSGEVSANLPIERWGTGSVSLRVSKDADWAVTMRPSEARAAARQLRRAADLVDPPAPRKPRK